MANGSGPHSELGHGGGDDAAPGPDGQPRAGRAWYGAGRAAAEGEEGGGATASGENEQQNGVAAQGSQAAAANPGSLPPHYKCKILGIQEAQVLREAKPRLGRPGRGKAHGANETGTMVSGKTESGLLVIGGVLIGVGVNGATPTTQSLT